MSKEGDATTPNSLNAAATAAAAAAAATSTASESAAPFSSSSQLRSGSDNGCGAVFARPRIPSSSAAAATATTAVASASATTASASASALPVSKCILPAANMQKMLQIVDHDVQAAKTGKRKRVRGTKSRVILSAEAIAHVEAYLNTLCEDLASNAAAIRVEKALSAKATPRSYQDSDEVLTGAMLMRHDVAEAASRLGLENFLPDEERSSKPHRKWPNHLLQKYSSP